MKKLFSKINIILVFAVSLASAQQDPQFTQFMFNKLVYNAGYAGVSGGSCGVIQYRKQWAGFDGAPTSYAVAVNSPLPGLPLGVGLTVISDKLGPMTSNFARIGSSFKLKIGPGDLGLGIDFGILSKSVSSAWIVPEPLRNDPRIPGLYGSNGYDNGLLNKIAFDLGFGAYYEIPNKFYIGVSSTHLPAQTIQSSNDLEFQISRHYYIMAGYSAVITPWLKLKPNILTKTDISSTTFDANLNLLWSDLFWVGGTFRSSHAVALLAGIQLPFGSGNSGTFKIGYSNDITTGSMASYAGGTNELILSVCYAPKAKKRSSHGNDRFLD